VVWEFSGNHGFMRIFRIDETCDYLSFGMVGDDFPHRIDFVVAGCLGAEEIIAEAFVCGAVEFVGVLYFDTVVCSASVAAALGENAGNDFCFAWRPIGTGKPAGKRLDAGCPTDIANYDRVDHAEDEFKTARVFGPGDDGFLEESVLCGSDRLVCLCIDNWEEEPLGKMPGIRQQAFFVCMIQNIVAGTVFQDKIQFL